MNLCTACRNGDTANCSGVALYTPAVYIPCDNERIAKDVKEGTEVTVPNPTTRLTAKNMKDAAECVEFLVMIARRNTDDLDSIETEQFQETNWDTLVWSMKAWVLALEVAEAVREQSDTQVSQQSVRDTYHDFVPGGMVGCCAACGYAPWARSHEPQVSQDVGGSDSATLPPTPTQEEK